MARLTGPALANPHEKVAMIKRLFLRIRSIMWPSSRRRERIWVPGHWVGHVRVEGRWRRGRSPRPLDWMDSEGLDESLRAVQPSAHLSSVTQNDQQCGDVDAIAA